MAKSSDRILAPSQYVPVPLPGFEGRLASRSDISPHFPILHLEELSPDGKISPDVKPDTYGVTVMQDFAVCGGIFLDSPDMRYFSGESRDGAHRLLAGILGSIRMGERAQFVWQVVDEMDPIFLKYAEVKPEDPPLVDFMRRSRMKREESRFRNGSLRQFSTAAYLMVPPDSPVLSVKNISDAINLIPLWKTSNSKTFFKNIENTYQRWSDRMAQFSKSFKEIPGMRVHPVHSTELIRQYRRLFSPDWWENIRGKPIEDQVLNLYDRPVPLAAQCLVSNIMDAGPYFCTGSYYHRVLTVEVPPTYVDMVLLMDALTSESVLDSAPNLEITLSLDPRSPAREIKALESRAKLIRKQIRSKAGRETVQDMEEQVVQLDSQITQLKNNERIALFSAVLTVHIWDKNVRRLSLAEESIIRHISDTTSMVLSGEDMASLPYFMHYCVPAAPGVGDTHRQMSMTSDEVAPLIPLMGQGAGVISTKPDPLVPAWFETGLGTPFVLDFFARGFVNNYNGITVGGSGSGKSFLYNYILASYANRQTRAIVVDAAVGTPSFKPNCLLLGGVYVDQRFRFNALQSSTENGRVLIPDQTQMSNMVLTLEAMVRKDANTPLQSPERAVLREGLNYLFNNPPADSVPYLRHLPDALLRAIPKEDETRRPVAEAYANQIRSTWTVLGGSNNFSGFVDGPDDFEKSWLTVFDLKWALDKPELLTVIMTLIFRSIDEMSRNNELKKDNERERLLVITDEGWKPLFDPAFAQLYLGLYKAGRSRYISAHLLTQDFNDFLTFMRKIDPTNPDVSTSPIITQSSHIISARLDVQEARKLGETLNVPASQWMALTELVKQEGKFSQYGYFCRGASSSDLLFTTLAYVPLPEEVWAFSSQSEDAAVRLSLRDALAVRLHDDGFRKRALEKLGVLGWNPLLFSQVRDEQFIMYLIIVSKASNVDFLTI